jgi:transposase
MVPQLSPSKKSVIFELHERGMSNRKIAERFNCHHTTITRTITNMKKHESPYYTTPGRGRKQLLDERDGRRIEREILSGRARDISDLRKSLQLPCSDSTLRRALYKMGMHGRLRRKKPYLKPVHVRKRKAWARKFQKWTPFQWRIVWFSDESKYKLFGSDGKIYCWRRVGEEFHPRNTIPTVKGSTGKVNVWGVISYHGVGRLHRVVGNMDSEQLKGILEDSLLRSFDDRRTDPTYLFYAMDNDPKHSSR